MKRAVIILMVLALAACTTIHPDQLRQGMTDREVMEIESPTQINRTVSGHDVQEQWVYTVLGDLWMILYFENGILQGWQQFTP